MDNKTIKVHITSWEKPLYSEFQLFLAKCNPILKHCQFTELITPTSQ